MTDFLLLSLLLLFAVAGCQKDQVIELESHTIEKDTTWTGTVILAGDVYVPPGVTLTVTPGTTVKFRKIDEKSGQNMFHADSPYYPEAELIVRGRLIAKGSPDKQIVFTSAEMTPRAADWGAINFLGSEGNVIDHAKIYCAYNGIHAHGAEVTVTNTDFARNGVGISFKKEEETPDVPWFGTPSRLKIIGNTFSRNKGGIGFRNSIAEISHNEISDNKFFGIWPKEDSKAVISFNEITGNQKGVYLYQVQGMELKNNNIYNNRTYDVAIAEAQDFTVNVSGNWFGTTDSARIDEMLFDRNDDEELAEIVFEPVLQQPVDWKRP